MNRLFVSSTMIFFALIIFAPRMSSAVCGSGWLDQYIPDAYNGCDFTQACQHHDDCYSSCGDQASSKASCDNSFLNNLNEAVLNGSVSVGCSEVVNVYYAAVVNHGQSAYDAAQGDFNNPCKECVNGVIRNKQGDYLFPNEPCKICSNGNKTNAPDGAIPRINGYYNICQVCSGGAIVNNDSPDPGMCKKCKNGAVANDDSEDPGTCKKCENGAVANDDSKSCNDFNPCTEGDHCSGGVCVGTPIANPSPSSPECQ